MRISQELKEVESKWIGQRVKYFILDALDKKSHGRKLDGPYFGKVNGITDNSAMIEDRLEGNTGRNSVRFTGQLIVQPDHKNEEDLPSYLHTEIIKP